MRSFNFRVYFLVFGCCEVEKKILTSSIYDLSRLGIDVVSSPCEANVIVVGGWLNESLVKKIKEDYQQMSLPRYVVGVGTCAISASLFGGAPTKNKVLADIIPVDTYAPGCPPQAEVYIDALLALRNKIKPQPLHREILKSAIKSESVQV